MANLVIEIGNTALKAAWAEGKTLGKTYRYQGEKTIDFILSITEKERPEVMAVVSAKELSADDESVLKGECRHLMLLDSNHPDYLQRYGIPEYLSYDRACSIMAVRHLLKANLAPSSTSELLLPSIWWALTADIAEEISPRLPHPLQEPESLCKIAAAYKHPQQIPSRRQLFGELDRVRSNFGHNV